MRAFVAGCGTSSPAIGTASPTRSTVASAYGVQVNSLGLTEAQPENNVAADRAGERRGDAVEARPRPRGAGPGVERGARAPRPWDQQWSLRFQQVLAYESDLLEYEDLFDGSLVVEAKVAELVDGARGGRWTGCR